MNNKNILFKIPMNVIIPIGNVSYVFSYPMSTCFGDGCCGVIKFSHSFYSSYEDYERNTCFSK